MSTSSSRARARNWRERGEKSDLYVSRAALKLDSVATDLKLDFRGKTVLDVGSSTGGFTDYALQHGASKVIAVDSGTNQLNPKLRLDTRVELYEKTDIRDVWADTGGNRQNRQNKKITKDTISIELPDITLIDVSFVSLRHILPHLINLSDIDTQIVAMLKPQFEASDSQKMNGIIKNSAIRRKIIRDFEVWLVNNKFIIQAKRDSNVAGTKGNIERFYVLQKSQ